MQSWKFSNAVDVTVDSFHQMAPEGREAHDQQFYHITSQYNTEHHSDNLSPGLEQRNQYGDQQLLNQYNEGL